MTALHNHLFIRWLARFPFTLPSVDIALAFVTGLTLLPKHLGQGMDKIALEQPTLYNRQDT